MQLQSGHVLALLHLGLRVVLSAVGIQGNYLQQESTKVQLGVPGQLPEVRGCAFPSQMSLFQRVLHGSASLTWPLIPSHCLSQDFVSAFVALVINNNCLVYCWHLHTTRTVSP